jgi:hypothetical protein
LRGFVVGSDCDDDEKIAASFSVRRIEVHPLWYFWSIAGHTSLQDVDSEFLLCWYTFDEEATASDATAFFSEKKF